MRLASTCVALLVGALAFAHVPTASATGVADLLPTYTGPVGLDLDVLRAQVTFDRSTGRLIFTATLGGRIGQTPGALYVFGLDRGTGTARFVGGSPSIGQGVLFDSALVVNSNGTAFFNDLLNVRITTLAPGAIRIDGRQLTVRLPAHLVPPAGRPIKDWTFNIWPRVGLGLNDQVSDFTPDASNAILTLTP